MSIERTIINRSQANTISTIAKSIISIEAEKGCSPIIYDFPVELEPTYLNPINWTNVSQIQSYQNYKKLENHSSNEYESFNCWISKEHTLDWIKAERFIKLLNTIESRICFEINGNKEKININFHTARNDSEILKLAIMSEYPNCFITQNDKDQLQFNKIYFRDFYPQPPYHHLFTRPSEIVNSPYDTYIYALTNLPNEIKGFLQILFIPVKNDWHQNVEILNDLEFMSKTINDPRSYQRIKQQLPSGDIRNMARDIETKAHNDKPFFSVSIRVGVTTEYDNFNLSGLTSFMNLFQHGGNKLNYITQNEYLEKIDNKQIIDMIENNLTYRSGFLLNSSELSGLVHIPAISHFTDKNIYMDYLANIETIPIEKEQEEGIIIGYSKYSNKEIPVRITDQIRKTGIHIIGRSGSGKSTLMENLILQDIDNNIGIALIDPHGDTIQRILSLIPENKIESTIYIDFGNTEFIPIWNPLKRINNQSIGRTADDLLASFKSIIKTNMWGHRLEHLLRNGFNGLLHIEDSTLFDLLIIFEQSRNMSREKRILTDIIKNAVENEVAKRFWQKDFPSYKRDDFAPSHHKLSMLLNSDETVSLMLSQPDNKLNFNEIIEQNKVLLLDLSNVGPDTRKILGSYLLSTLHNYSISRNSIDMNNRNPFSIYCDEAHKFTPDTLEDMITDARKFGINLTFAHQFLNQFNTDQRDALLSMGSSIIFNVDLFDAKNLINNLQSKVEVKDILTLKTGEAFSRIGTQIIKFETNKPKQILKENFKNDIIKKSIEKYYKPISTVKKNVNERLKRFGIDTEPIRITEELELEKSDFKFEYDEFD
ncbi:MAG: ATP-binding protein [Ignavibacteriae bacterium]|nr:ATP-binding protein [Ignavibacteriota bacterium]